MPRFSLSMTTVEHERPPIPDDAPGRSPRAIWPRVGIALVLILVPLMLLALEIPPVRGKGADRKQDWVLGLSIAVAIASAAAYFIPSPLFPRRRSTLPLIVFGTAMLLLANIFWNRSFLDYTRHHDYVREVFRRPMRNFHAPMYGRYDNAIARSPDGSGPPYDYSTVPWVIVSSGVALAWFAWARRRPLEKRWTAGSFAILLAFQLALIICFALCEPPDPRKPGAAPMRMTLQLSGYSEFASDIPAFTGIRDTLRNYVAKMPSLNWYGQHYPPGNLILLMIEKRLGLPGLTKSIVCLLTVLSAIPLYRLAKELELDDVAATAALLLFTATTGVLIYCTINMTSLVLLPATMCLWMLVRSLKTGSLTAAALLGLFFAIYLLFSFSASILGVLMALTTLLGWWSGVFSIRNIVRTGAVSLACVFGCIALIYVTTKFNVVACFFAAVRGHQTQQGNEGFDEAKRWLLRSTGNIIAYLVSIVPLSILAAGAVRHAWNEGSASERLRRAFFTATLVTVLIAGFSGLFYVETERIWIFLTPAFALAAGFELRRRSTDEGRGVIYLALFLVLAISCTQEFFFQHYR
ncbi:MAG: hypothetical protein QOF78_2054 [Phycisphaerales bacterium]|nr:hypothetical protein [Phycisphaerales bacterium]